MFKTITIGSKDYHLQAGAMIMHPDPRNMFDDLGLAWTPASVKRVIKEGLMIVDLSWVEVVPVNRAVLKCSRDHCDGILCKQDSRMLCRKCDSFYVFDKDTKKWNRDKAEKFVISRIPDHEGRGEFYKETNDKLNKFRMIGTGSKEVDKHRNRNWNNLLKEIKLQGQRKMYCPDGKIRMVSWEHVNKGVRITGYSEEEYDDFEIDEDMASIEDGRGAYAGYRVLRLKKFSGTMPTDSEYHIISEMNYVPSVKVNKKSRTKKTVRKSHAKKHPIKDTSEVDKIQKEMDKSGYVYNKRSY